MDPDLRYCREALPRVSRTFAINIRLLAAPLRDTVGVAYLLCRAADTLEDSWPDGGLADRFDDFASALGDDASAASRLAAEAGRAARARGGADLEMLAELPRVLRAFGALAEEARPPVRECVATMAAGMRRYAVRGAARGGDAAYLDDEAELDDYCWVVAGCVGVMLTKLYALAYGGGETPAQSKRIALAPRVGQALQLTNILLDWPTDVRKGRCHVPAAWLEEAGLRPADLVAVDRPGARALARRLEAKALAALACVPDYVDAVPERHLRYRLFCLWPALWAERSLRQARRDPQFPWGPRRPKLPRHELWRTSIATLFTPDPGARLRRLCGAAPARS